MTAKKSKPKPPVDIPLVELGIDGVRQQQVSINSTSETWDVFKAMNEANGVSTAAVLGGVVEAFVMRELRLADDLSIPAKAKLERALRQHQRMLDAKFYEALGEAVERVVKDVWLPRHRKLVADADRLLAARRGIMTKQQHQLLRRCLHPDNSASTEKRAEAFRVFEDIDPVLLFDEAEDARTTDVPPLKRASKG